MNMSTIVNLNLLICRDGFGQDIATRTGQSSFLAGSAGCLRSSPRCCSLSPSPMNCHWSCHGRSCTKIQRGSPSVSKRGSKWSPIDCHHNFHDMICLGCQKCINDINVISIIWIGGTAQFSIQTYAMGCT